MEMTFICEKEKGSEELGFRPVNQPTFDAFQGIAVAHDVMEHQEDTDDSMEHEFMAMGASIFVRETYYKGQFGRDTPAENFGPMLAYMIQEIASGRAKRISDCPTHWTTIDNPWARRQLKKAQSRMEYAFVFAVYWSEYPSAHMSTNALNWVAEGYRRTMARYAGIPQEVVQKAFEQIARAVDDRLKHCAIGDKIKIIMEVKEGKLHIGGELLV